MPPRDFLSYKAHAIAAALCMTLTGCDRIGLAAPWPLEPKPLSQGVNPNAKAVDGLLVGHRLMEAGEYELALKAYYRAAAQDGLSADALAAIGSANLALGRLGQAEQVLRRASEKDPNSVAALNNLGVVLVETRKFGEARRVFQRAYALDSGQSDAIRNNLKLAIARSEASVYAQADTTQPVTENSFQLVRQGQGQYVLLSEL